jgi:alpha-tubulin suppressor-like RCC1 family protein
MPRRTFIGSDDCDQAQSAPQNPLAGPAGSKLFSWGWNASGQLGREAEDDVSTGAPGEVMLPDDVCPSAAAGGRAHSVAVGSAKFLFQEGYGWGSGR